MEESNRISRYLAGESVTAIAKDEGVSRQAVIDFLKRAGVHKDKVDVKSRTKGVASDKPTPVSQKTLSLISGYTFDDARGEVSFGDNVFWKAGVGFYWKRWVGSDEPLVDVPLPALSDTFDVVSA